MRDGFGIADLADALAPAVKIPGKADRDELLPIYADLLGRYGREILRGDFRTFPRIKEAAKRRIIGTDPDWMPLDARPAAPRNEPLPRVRRAALPVPVSDKAQESSARVVSRRRPASSRAELIVLGGIVLFAALVFGANFRNDLRRHRDHRRFMATGRPVVGTAGEAHAGVFRHGIPAWTEVTVDADPFRRKRFGVRGAMPAGSTVEMLCIDEEGRCAGAEDLRRHLREWPWTHGTVIGVLVLIVPTTLLLGARWIARMAR